MAFKPLDENNMVQVRGRISNGELSRARHCLGPDPESTLAHPAPCYFIELDVPVIREGRLENVNRVSVMLVGRVAEQYHREPSPGKVVCVAGALRTTPSSFMDTGRTYLRADYIMDDAEALRGYRDAEGQP